MTASLEPSSIDKKLGSTFSLNVIRRIFLRLQENRSIKRTNLALEANVNYVRLSNHLDWLEKKKFIELVVENGKIVVRLTQGGQEFAVALASFVGFITST